ncbi:MAG: hypothetical protein ABIA93_06010 [Candidatus Woesearchaeota archaeon]
MDALIEPKLRGTLIGITGDRFTGGEFLIRLALKAQYESVLFLDPLDIFDTAQIEAQYPHLAEAVSRVIVGKPVKGSLLPLLKAIKPSLILLSDATPRQLQELRFYARRTKATVFFLGDGGDVDYVL